MKFLIGLDIDGTIVDHDGHLHPETIHHIKKWSNEGHVITLVTGRPFRNTKHIYEALALNTPICNHSGAQVHHPSDPSFPPLHHSIPASYLHQVIEQAKDAILNGYAEVGDTVYLYRAEKNLLEWIQTTSDQEVIIGTLDVGDSFTGAVLFVDPSHTEAIQQLIESLGKVKSRHWRTLKFMPTVYPKPRHWNTFVNTTALIKPLRLQLVTAPMTLKCCNTRPTLQQWTVRLMKSLQPPKKRPIRMLNSARLNTSKRCWAKPNTFSLAVNQLFYSWF